MLSRDFMDIWCNHIICSSRPHQRMRWAGAFSWSRFRPCHGVKVISHTHTHTRAYWESESPAGPDRTRDSLATSRWLCTIPSGQALIAARLHQLSVHALTSRGRRTPWRHLETRSGEVGHILNYSTSHSMVCSCRASGKNSYTLILLKGLWKKVKRNQILFSPFCMLQLYSKRK